MGPAYCRAKRRTVAAVAEARHQVAAVERRANCFNRKRTPLAGDASGVSCISISTNDIWHHFTPDGQVALPRHLQRGGGELGAPRNLCPGDLDRWTRATGRGASGKQKQRHNGREK
jgi:hypothetical protein